MPGNINTKFLLGTTCRSLSRGPLTVPHSHTREWPFSVIEIFAEQARLFFDHFRVTAWGTAAFRCY
jgi:hypothetical protein